jgi:hypothetical protein
LRPHKNSILGYIKAAYYAIFKAITRSQQYYQHKNTPEYTKGG